MIGKMSLDDLRLFLAVAQTLSFIEAARRTSIPVSTLSRRISVLEGRLGTRLFQRTSRSVALTQEGARLAEHAGPLFRSLEDVVELARSDAEPSGRLRVTATVVSGAEWIAPALLAFAVRYPRVNLELRLTNAAVDLIEEQVDLAFRVGPITDQGLIKRRLWVHTYGLAASPDLVRRMMAGRPVIERRQLTELPFVLTRTSPLRLVNRTGRVEEVSPAARIRVDDPRVAIQAAVAGLGLVCAPHDLLAQAGRRLSLITVKGYEFEPREMFALYPSRRFLPTRVRLALEWVTKGASPG